MRKTIIGFLFAFMFLLSSLTYSHQGRLRDDKGHCDHNKKEYHYHKGGKIVIAKGKYNSLCKGDSKKTKKKTSKKKNVKKSDTKKQEKKSVKKSTKKDSSKKKTVKKKNSSKKKTSKKNTTKKKSSKNKKS